MLTDLIPVPLAASLLHVHRKTVIRWAQDGLIRLWRRGGRLFVLRTELEGMFKEQAPPSRFPDVRSPSRRETAESAAASFLASEGF